MGDRFRSELRILSVDDEEFLQNLSVRVLKNLGYENVTSTGNGVMALAEIREAKAPYDVVITDLNMPEMDGVELLRHLAVIQYSGGIILLSGEDERILETALELANAHRLNILGAVPKPLKPEVIKGLLERLKPARPKVPYQPQEPITEAELLKGLENDELQLVYQPKVDVRKNKITGVEALARWHHAERGILGPGAFIPVAEQSGLIDGLTYAVYKKAIRQAGTWHAKGLNLTISINISINTFTLPNFTEFLLTTAQQESVDPAMVILEVTESQAMSNILGCLEKMMHLRMKKFGLSIDDFGTGQSSMEQLKRIPFTELKIDRAFVHGAAAKPSARAMLETSVDLGKRLKMDIVAEGAETREDWDLVAQTGCDYVQGYYVAKPMPNHELLQFVDTWKLPPAVKSKYAADIDT